MKLDRLDWIQLGEETPVDANLRIVDPHHHLWDRGGSRYLAEELHEDTSKGHNVTNTVFIECKAEYRRNSQERFRSLGETEFVVKEAERLEEFSETKISGIVGFVDLGLGEELEEVLVAHDRSSYGLMRGVRHATAWSDDPEISIAHTKPTKGVMGSKLFLKGVSKLSEFDFSFDAWLYFNQLPELLYLARVTPETNIVINHLAAPLKIGKWAETPQEVDEIWRSNLQELANCENVYLKIGGIGMDNYFANDWVNQTKPPTSDEVASVWKEKILWCIELFGTHRCMFESNYPVDRQTLPYSVIWNCFQKVTDSFTESEKSDLFSSTACTVYRIP
ncbi:MAG: amidohydrolase [Acidimicrobiaceae bacterium]|nr:amidohydrolase [Acidimicrobiaceae bacterium]